MPPTPPTPQERGGKRERKAYQTRCPVSLANSNIYVEDRLAMKGLIESGVARDFVYICVLTVEWKHGPVDASPCCRCDKR